MLKSKKAKGKSKNQEKGEDRSLSVVLKIQ
jgi:hypothetical protein